MSGSSEEARALELLDRALEQPSDARVAWLRARRGDPAVRDRALSLLASAGDARDLLRTGGAPSLVEPPPPPDRIGAYRITGLIGQGGMGAVYRGERAGDFEHLAAIKVIRPGALSAALVERFRRERQTLARLAHPNIARLYDGGETAAGEPYIVMEFVEGQPLQAWIEAARPSLDARLALFAAVCGAVAFAHQNLVVHGDVTPANILVAADGQPKLIDFGIARPLAEADAAPAQRAAAARTGTPGYAAPERLAGAPATTLSDVYSLGRVLADLCGPVDRELAAIVARATADDPADRYTTAEALRADIDAYRTGFPVSPMGRGRGYLLARFVRRHRLGVAAAGVATTLLLGAFAATLVANAQAEAARAEAEARFGDVRTLAKSLMFEVYDEVGKVPGSIDARLVLARTAQTYLDRLAADPDAPVDVRLEAGEGYFRLGQVVGFTSGGSLGRREEGKALFAKSQAILEELHRRYPERADVRLALGHQLSVLAGENLYSDGDWKTARQQAIRARTLLVGLPQLTERSAGALAGAYLYEGDSYGWENDIPGAGRVYETGIALVQRMPPALRDSEPVRVSLGGLLRQAGEVYRYTNQPQRAIGRMKEAVALNRRLAAASNGAPMHVRKLINSLWSLADMQRIAGDLPAAYATITEAHALARDMMRKSPNDAGAAEMQAFTGFVLAQVLSERGDHAPAVAKADETVRINQTLVARSGGNKGSRLTLAHSLNVLSPVYARAGDKARACEVLRQAHAILTGYQEISAIDRENILKPVQKRLEGCRT